MGRVSIIALFAAACALAQPAVAQATGDGPERAVSRFWRALSNAPGASADTATLQALFHPQAVIFGSRLREGAPSVSRTEVEAFLARTAVVSEAGFYECEIARSLDVHDRFAAIYSVVESRTDPDARDPDFTGVNSLQLYRDEDGWKILALYYHVSPDPNAILDRGTSGVCLD